MKIISLRKKDQDKNKSRYERGASLVEYGLLVALIAVIGIPAVTAVGERLSSTFENDKMIEALPGGGAIGG